MMLPFLLVPQLAFTLPDSHSGVPQLARAEEEIQWFQGSLKSIRIEATTRDQGVLFVVYTEQSPWCTRLFETSLKDKAVLSELSDLVCVKVNLSQDADGRSVDANSAEIASRFPVRSLPTMLFLGKALSPEDMIEGYIPGATLAAELSRMKSGAGTLSALRSAVKAAPEDVETLWSLAVKVDDFGYQTEYLELMDRIAILDPKRRSRPLRSQALQILEEELFRAFTKNGTYDTQRLIAFLKDETNPSVAFQGWSTLAGLSRNLRSKATNKKSKREFGELSRSSHQRAWELVVPANLPSYACTILNDYFEDRASLNASDRRLVKNISKQLEDALAQRSDTPLVQAIFLDALSCAAAIGKQPETALVLIDKAIALDPATPAYVQRRQALLGLPR